MPIKAIRRRFSSFSSQVEFVGSVDSFLALVDRLHSYGLNGRSVAAADTDPEKLSIFFLTNDHSALEVVLALKSAERVVLVVQGDQKVEGLDKDLELIRLNVGEDSSDAIRRIYVRFHQLKAQKNRLNKFSAQNLVRYALNLLS